MPALDVLEDFHCLNDLFPFGKRIERLGAGAGNETPMHKLSLCSAVLHRGFPWHREYAYLFSHRWCLSKLFAQIEREGDRCDTVDQRTGAVRNAARNILRLRPDRHGHLFHRDSRIGRVCGIDETLRAEA